MLSGCDKKFIWSSLWASRFQEIPGFKDKSLPEIYEVMDNVLLQKYPITMRRMNVERIK